MKKFSLILLLFGVSLGGCAGVPQLYRPASKTPSDPNAPTDSTLAPKVNDIIDEITCELLRANNRVLQEKPHAVTVLLTLQVDDNLNVTPTFLFTNPLSGTNRTFGLSQGVDIGGARKRTFTTTFHLDTAKLKSYVPMCADRQKKRLYSLEGELGLSEIVRDGTATIAKLRPIQLEGDDKKQPSYGSTVQFVVNRSVTALGPLWTLNTFKGPSGSNGLINGKQLNTDILTITFAPVSDTTPNVIARQKEADAKALDVARIVRERSEAERLYSAAIQSRIMAERAASRFSSTKSAQDAAGQARSDEAKAEAERNALVQDEARAREELRIALEQVRAAENVRAQDTSRAAAASDSLLNTMVLQGIGAIPH